MKENGSEREYSTVSDDEFTESFTYILAGFEENLDGLDINGLSLQRIGQNDYRLVLRAIDRRAADDPIPVVSFTNSDSPFRCMFELENALRGGKIKFVIDRYATTDFNNGNSETKRAGFRLID